MERCCRGAWRRKGSRVGRGKVRCPWRPINKGAIVVGVEVGAMVARVESMPSVSR